MTDDFDRNLRKFRSKMVQRFDQEIQEVRENYFSLDSNERKTFRKWIEGLVEVLETEPEHCMRLSVRIIIDNSVIANDGEVVYEGDVSMSPRIILDAIKAWDDDQDYTPPFGEICM